MKGERIGGWGTGLVVEQTDTGMATSDSGQVQTPAQDTNIVIKLPYTIKKCCTCQKRGTGNFVVETLKDMMQHIGVHHRNVPTVFQCSKCEKKYDSKHAASCHIPKCPGPTRDINDGHQCDSCSRTFRTKSGLSQHERSAHPVLRNEKRAAAAQPATSQPKSKGYGKTWTKEEIDTMLLLEAQFAGHQQVAKQMEAHLPGKTAKQIRDKRREPTYRRRLEEHQRSTTISSAAVPRDLHVTPIPTLPVNTSPITSPHNRDPSILNVQLPNPSGHTLPPASLDIPSESLNEVGIQPPTSPVSQTQVVETCEEQNIDRCLQDLIIDTCLQQLDGDDDSNDEAKLISLYKTLFKDAKVSSGQLTQEQIDKVYSTMIQTCMGDLTQHKVSRKRSAGSGKKSKKRMSKKYIYARTQNLYKNDPRSLARFIREDTNWLNNSNDGPSPDNVQTLYKSLWGTSPPITIPFNDEPIHENLRTEEIFGIITIDDIRIRISRMGTKTAPGLDGVEVKHLKKASTMKMLSYLFNLLSLSGRQPTDWRRNRTTLIPKPGKDPQAENYRPITISSLISRLYWGIIDNRLREKTRFSPRQKGFVYEAGCFNNVHIFNEVIRLAKTKKGMVCVQLDIAKAFDTIPHQVIKPAMIKHGIPLRIASAVTNSYLDVSTTIKCKEENIEVNLLRGVKQGDPLSPFIFNTILDPLLYQLESQTGFSIDENNNISCLAFADDLLLLADDVPKAQLLLSTTEQYFNQLGMKIAAHKCASFRIITTRDCWYLANPKLGLSTGEEIPTSTADTTLKYLGGNISPWDGLKHNDQYPLLKSTLTRLGKSHLKPVQKLSLLSTNLIPHFLHSAILTMTPRTSLRNMDSLIRTFIKDTLHLPQCTPNGIIYCTKRDGGLSIPKLENLVTSTLRQGITLLNTMDPVLEALFNQTGLEHRMEAIARTARLKWPNLTFKDLASYKLRLKRDELKQWSRLPSKGKSVLSFQDDKFGNCWLYKPDLLKPSRFTTALRLRSGTTGDKVTMNTIVPQNSVACRRCGAQLETLAHVLGQCSHMKGLVIKRHNSIRDFVSSATTKREEVEVFEEPSNETPADLVVIHRKRVHVVDVTVRHEDVGYLQRGYEKISKYTPLLQILGTKYEANPGRVLPIVIGATGAIPKTTIEALEELGISDKQSLMTITLLALRSSIEIYHAFLDYKIRI
jgi:hypothetical protein